MCWRVMCGYSITWKPRSKVWPSAETIALTWNSPAPTLDAGLSMKRTVCDSSERVNFTGCSAGVAVHPCGTSSFTDVSAGPVVSLTTVTRISRSGIGAPLAAERRPVWARRHVPRPWFAPSWLAPPVPASIESRTRNDRDLRRHANRERRHDQQLGALLAAEDVAFVAILHRQAVNHLDAAGQRQRHLNIEGRRPIGSPNGASASNV